MRGGERRKRRTRTEKGKGKRVALRRYQREGRIGRGKEKPG